MANNDRGDRKRMTHYVPIELIDLFNAEAAQYPALTKQGFFEAVVRAGLDAIAEKPMVLIPGMIVTMEDAAAVILEDEEGDNGV
jgi:predicted metal-dependent phosphoesterase TrpH